MRSVRRKRQGLLEKIQPSTRMAYVGFVYTFGNFRIWNLEPKSRQRINWRSVHSPVFSVPTYNFNLTHFDFALDSHPDCTQVDADPLGLEKKQTSGCLSASTRSLRINSDGVHAVPRHIRS